MNPLPTESPCIAYLTSEYGRASDTFIRNEVHALRGLGCTVHTFSVRRPREVNPAAQVVAEQASTYYLLEHAGPLLWATFLTILSQPGQLLRALRLWLQLLRNSRFAVMRHVFYLCEACLLARCLKQRKVQWLHNHIAENSAAVAMLASTLCDIPYSMTVHGPGIFFHPRAQSLGLKIRQSAFTACITEFCRSQCMIFCDPADSHRLKIVHCAVGPEFLETEPTPVPQTSQLLFVGRFCIEKGLLILLQATKRLIDDGLHPKLVLIGDGDLRREIEGYINLHCLDSHVVLMGSQSSEVVTQQLLASRALVLSSFAEGLPVVCMEALAMGRPVIAPHIAGIPELIKDGVNGWLVTPSSVESLYAAMRDALTLPTAQLDKMGAEGRRQVEVNHNPTQEPEKLLQFIMAEQSLSRTES